MNRWSIIAAMVLAAGAYTYGRHDGTRLCQARHDAATLAQERADATATRALALAEQRARLLAQALEDQAREDPVAAPACLSRARVLRLYSRQGPSRRPVRIPSPCQTAP